MIDTSGTVAASLEHAAQAVQTATGRRLTRRRIPKFPDSALQADVLPGEMHVFVGHIPDV